MWAQQSWASVRKTVVDISESTGHAVAAASDIATENPSVRVDAMARGNVVVVSTAGHHRGWCVLIIPLKCRSRASYVEEQGWSGTWSTGDSQCALQRRRHPHHHLTLGFSVTN